MLSWVFAAAAVLLVVAARIVPRPWRPATVAAASLGAMHVVWPIPVAALGAAAGAVWALGRLLPRVPAPARTPVLTAGIVAVLVSQRLGPALHGAPLIGLSYAMLRLIQHLVDAAGGRVGHVGLPAFLGTVFFLPTWPAGPIERTDGFTRELADADDGWTGLPTGLARVVLGLGRKLLLADPLLAYALPIFAAPDQHGAGELAAALYAYALGLYLDFGGYSDIAIGIAACAGLRVRENFDWPYLQPNLAALWQRWHMSLTGWLRDFLFFPVARRMLRATGRPLPSQLAAQTVTMLACGLWHGLAWNYAAWGLFHAAGLSTQAAWRSWRGPAPAATGWRRVVGTLATFHFFVAGLILFAGDLHTGARIVAGLLGWRGH